MAGLQESVATDVPGTVTMPALAAHEAGAEVAVASLEDTAAMRS